jgi:RNA recognition motif-containing protein
MAKEIYVGHISENATEEDVWKLFSVMGTVTSVHLIIDPETGEFKRCGYVRMASGISLEEVVETLDGTYLIDREIVVSIARPQKPGMSKSGGNKQPWMKSGPKPGVQPGIKPGTRPKSKPKSDSAADVRSKPAGASKPGTKPAARTEARPFQGKRPAGSGKTARPRTSK